VRALHLTEAQQLSKETPIDIAFVCTKSYDTHWASLLIRQYLAPGGYVVSLQNCMNEAAIAEVVDWARGWAASPATSASASSSPAMSIAAGSKAAFVISRIQPKRIICPNSRRKVNAA
jgi:ketopantoate reductase